MGLLLPVSHGQITNLPNQRSCDFVFVAYGIGVIPEHLEAWGYLAPGFGRGVDERLDRTSAQDTGVLFDDVVVAVYEDRGREPYNLEIPDQLTRGVGAGRVGNS